MSLLQLSEETEPTRSIRLVVLGAPGVGKTAIVHRFLYDTFTEAYFPTVEDFHRKIYRIRGQIYRLDILDTSGHNPFPALKRVSLLTGDIYLIVYSVSDSTSLISATQLRDDVVEARRSGLTSSNGTTSVPIVFVGNKSDLRQTVSLDEAHTILIEKGNTNMLIAEASAKNNVYMHGTLHLLLCIDTCVTVMSTPGLDFAWNSGSDVIV